jgi:glutathione S-transferase
LHQRRASWAATAVAAGAAVLAISGTPSAQAQPAAGQPTQPTSKLSIYQVPANGESAAERLLDAGFDVLENRYAGGLYVLGDERTAAQLKAAGFAPSGSEPVTAPNWTPPSTRLTAGAAAPQVDPIDETYFGGYRTVRAHHAHLDKVAAEHPRLAKVVDYGDSYLKKRDPATGYDLKAICITRRDTYQSCQRNPNVAKPRFLVMTQLHARELVTGDVSWRFIDHLVDNYGKDPEVTKLLKRVEVWVVPIANPDGVDFVQQGGDKIWQRKNLNADACPNPPAGSNPAIDGQRGVDLNRNNGYRWNTTGVSPDPCHQVYPGTAADSEPETYHLQKLFRDLWRDQRGPEETDEAPATARGALMSIHSYVTGGIALYPWGWKNEASANERSFRRMAGRISEMTGYRPGRPGEVLGSASGSIEDWTYGVLGVAPIGIELKSCNQFAPSYSCAPGEFAQILPSIMYMANEARAPFRS